jgi:hypothetical protein
VDGPSCEEQTGADGIGGVVAAAAGSAALGTVGTGAVEVDMHVAAAADGPQNDGGRSAAARAMT